MYSETPQTVFSPEPASDKEAEQRAQRLRAFRQTFLLIKLFYHLRKHSTRINPDAPNSHLDLENNSVRLEVTPGTKIEPIVDPYIEPKPVFSERGYPITVNKALWLKIISDSAVQVKKIVTEYDIGYHPPEYTVDEAVGAIQSMYEEMTEADDGEEEDDDQDKYGTILGEPLVISGSKTVNNKPESTSLQREEAILLDSYEETLDLWLNDSGGELEVRSSKAEGSQFYSADSVEAWNKIEALLFNMGGDLIQIAYQISTGADPKKSNVFKGVLEPEAKEAIRQLLSDELQFNPTIKERLVSAYARIKDLSA